MTAPDYPGHAVLEELRNHLQAQTGHRKRAEQRLQRVRDVRDRWIGNTLEPGQVRRLLDDLTAALEPQEDEPATDRPEAALAERVRSLVESEVYEYRERTMFWPETGGVTEEIARLATRGALEAVKPELDRIADYENRITWDTTCGSCARILDSSIRETERAERAEASVQRVTALHEQWVKAGPPPLGTSIARWWDKRLAEHHQAIQPPTSGDPR